MTPEKPQRHFRPHTVTEGRYQTFDNTFISYWKASYLGSCIHSKAESLRAKERLSWNTTAACFDFAPYNAESGGIIPG